MVLDSSIKLSNLVHLPFISKNGFRGVDLSFAAYEKRDEILAYDYQSKILNIYEQIKKYNLEISQVHLTFYPGHYAPIGDGTYKAFEEQMLPLLIKEIEITAKLNCKKAIIHPYFEKDIEKSQKGNITLITKLLPYIEKYEITLCIEDIYGPDFSPVHLTTSEELLFYTNYFDSQYIGICLDTGHALILGQNPVTLAKELGTKIKALHIHTTYDKLDHHLLPYSKGDTVDWKVFYNILLENGYSGTFNLETRPLKDISDDQIFGYFKQAFETVLKICDYKKS